MQNKNSANTIGIDVSHFNGVINWAQVATDPKNIKFAYIKCSEGILTVDANFPSNAAGARLNGIVMGAYHYLHPGTTVGFAHRNYNSTRALTEANHFITTLNSGLSTPGDYGDLHLVADVELPTSPSTGKSGVSALAETKLRLAYVNTFRNQVEGITGKRCMLYTANDQVTTWLNFCYPTSANPILDMPLWAASYLSSHGGSPPVQVGGWQQWLIWQYSSTGSVTGITSTGLDMNSGPSNINDLKDLPATVRGITPIKNLYVLNPSMKLKVVLSNDSLSCPFYDAVHKEQINQENSLKFSIPSNHPDAASVIEGNLVFYRDWDDPRQIQLFEILRIEESHLGPLFKDAICQHKVFELIDAWIENLTLNNVTAAKALYSILTYNSDVGNLWWTGSVQPTTMTRSFNFHRISVMDAMRKVVLSYGTEWRFRVEFIGSNVTVRYVDFLKRGSFIPFGSTYKSDFSGRTFEYGKDIKSIKRTIDSSRIVTKAYGIGHSSAITFSTVSWSTASGDPVTKPPHALVSSGNGQWVEDKTASCTWGRYVSTSHTPAALPRTAEFTYDTTNPKTLLTATWNYIQQNKTPWVAYEMEVADLEFIAGSEHQKVRLGNTIRVIDTLFEPVLRTSARVYEIDRNLTQPEKTAMVISNILPIIGAS